jgi:succinate dehydrogenase/fumarate reductase cytochrome b subunit
VFTLKKADLLPLIDAMANRLPSWKANLMNKVGHMTLIKVTLSVIPINISIAVAVSPWIYHGINRVRHLFIWTGTNSANGGKCMVA